MVLPYPRIRRTYFNIALMLLLGVAAALLAWHHLGGGIGPFPAEWNLGLRQPMDDFKVWAIGNRNSHPIFLYFFTPLSRLIDSSLRQVEAFLLWLPWPVLAAAIFLTAYRVANGGTALVTTGCLLLMGFTGYWRQSMQTLALMLIAVLIALLIGIPLGILSSRSDRLEKGLRPLLDAMQTMPAFVYLIPVLLLFGVARVPSVIATVIYALPPAIRLTNLGLRQVSAEALEAAQAFGSTPRQMLFKVQLPMALPTIMAGVNQTIMMALSIVVIAALIGGGGLGELVLQALRTLRVGRALEAGLAIVFMAILLDRLSDALARLDVTGRPPRTEPFRLASRWQGVGWASHVERAGQKFVRTGDRMMGWASRFTAHPYGLLSACFLLLLLLVSLLAGWQTFPPAWKIGLEGVTDNAVRWAQVHLYNIGGRGWGTGPFSDWLTLQVLNPLRSFLTVGLPWPVLILLVAAAGLALSGWRLAVGSGVGLLLLGFLGMWNASMDTLSQVIVAVLLAVLLGVPVGIAAARHPSLERGLRPLLDFLQTIPSFVYLVPVIMLFNLGRVPGIIASVLYALPPTIRLTTLGLKQVDAAATEAARAFGSTTWQSLRKVELPLALPSIMAGINQTIMMVLSMVIIAGLVGSSGLGIEVVTGLARNQLGLGVESGLAIVILAIIIDRLAQATVQRYQQAMNLSQG
ncbi:MAG: ABC transporter permease subunit [Anaerolineae bacterium]|nr:ABC transporter permease subunit [Anaerolineae bacterium]